MSRQPILITGAERSGATLIARILNMCGVDSGKCNGMFEHLSLVDFNVHLLQPYPLQFPESGELQIPVNWKKAVEGVLVAEQMGDKPWFVKHATLARTWPIWHYSYPDAKWLIVRRRTGDVIQSCVKTGYMRTFKDVSNLDALGLKSEEDGWKWWVRRYEERFVEMIQTGLNCRVVWPERMVYGNYQQIFETIEWLGLKWNNNIPKTIDPLLNKSREVFLYENNG